ncbi:MAG: protein-L-isoaspartate(D-aspartate) O-methyltransferase [Candidatus Aenigmatarchaeota archaeon]
MSLENLIRELKRQSVLESPKIEESLRNVDRKNFVREHHKKYAYTNSPLSIGENQTISQPLVVVKMMELLDLQEGNKVLEIGTGSGWQAGLLGYVVGEKGEVYSVERKHKLAEFAKANLKRSGIKNVEVIEDDGSLGYSKKSPYNKLIVTAASPEITDEWKKQLAEDGDIVVPIGKNVQTMVHGKKIKGEIEKIEKEKGYRFVPLKGKKGF